MPNWGKLSDNDYVWTLIGVIVILSLLFSFIFKSNYQSIISSVSFLTVITNLLLSRYQRHWEKKEIEIIQSDIQIRENRIQNEIEEAKEVEKKKNVDNIKFYCTDIIRLSRDYIKLGSINSLQDCISKLEDTSTRLKECCHQNYHCELDDFKNSTKMLKESLDSLNDSIMDDETKTTAKKTVSLIESILNNQ